MSHILLSFSVISFSFFTNGLIINPAINVIKANIHTNNIISSKYPNLSKKLCINNVGIDFGTSSICIAILDKQKNDISIATKKKNFPYIDNVISIDKRDVNVGNDGKGLIHNKVYYAKELLGKKYIDHDWFKNTGMQYRICNANNTLLIELMFNNNISRLFKAETIVAKILMFCKASIENFVGDDGYLAVFNYPCYWKSEELDLFDKAVRAAGFIPGRYSYLNDASAICTDIGRFHYTDENEKHMCIFSMGHTYSMAITARYSRDRNGKTVHAIVEKVEYSTYVCGRLFSKHFQKYVEEVLKRENIDIQKCILEHSNSGYYHSMVETAKREMFLEDYSDISLQLEDRFDLDDIELDKEEFLERVRGDTNMNNDLDRLMQVFIDKEKDTRSCRNGSPLYICMCGGASRSLIVQDKLKKLSDANKGRFHLSRILNEDECVARGLAYSFEGSTDRIPELDLASSCVQRDCCDYENIRKLKGMENSCDYIEKELQVFRYVEQEKKEFEEKQNQYRDKCAQLAKLVQPSVEDSYKSCKLIFSNLVTRGSSQYTKTDDMYELYEKDLKRLESRVEQTSKRLFVPYLAIEPVAIDEDDMEELGIQKDKKDTK